MQFSREVVASLKRARLAQGISQERLAEAAGISRSAVSMIESDERNPTLFVCHALAAALDVPLADFVTAAEKKTRSSRKRRR